MSGYVWIGMRLDRKLLGPILRASAVAEENEPLRGVAVLRCSPMVPLDSITAPYSKN